MAEQTDKELNPDWRIIAASVKGAAHERDGKPNQDAVGWRSTKEAVMLAIADGHGSDRYFRSNVGSRFAVEVAVNAMEQLVSEIVTQSPEVAVISNWTAKLPQYIVKRWREKVEAHLGESPLFTKEEWKRFQNQPALRADVTKNGLIPYGATLLAVLVMETFIVCLQLGDGDIAFVRENGKVVRPMPEDKRLLANETTSLCADTAIEDFRRKFYELKSPPPALIMLSTDGYANSFSTPDGFRQVSVDILRKLYQDGGLADVKRQFREWLQAATEEGSGDDTTVGIMCYLPIINKRPAPSIEPPPAEPATPNVQHHPRQDVSVTNSSDRPGGASNEPVGTNAQQQLQAGQQYYRPPEAPIASSSNRSGGASNEPAGANAQQQLQAGQQYYRPPEAPVAGSSNWSGGTSNEPAGANAQQQLQAGQQYYRPPEAPIASSSNRPGGASSDGVRTDASTVLSPGVQSKPPVNSGPHESAPERLAVQHQQQEKKVSGQQRVIVSQRGSGDCTAIREALDRVAPGGTIHVTPGVYRERLRIEKKGVRLEAGGESVHIESTVPCLDIAAQDVTVTGFKIRGMAQNAEKDFSAVRVSVQECYIMRCDISSQSRVGVLVQGVEAHATLADCLIHDTQERGIVFDNQTAGLLKDCVISRNVFAGVYLREKCSLEIEDCVFQQTGKKGIYIHGEGTQATLRSCQISHAKEIGVHLRGECSLTLVGCTIQYTGEKGINIGDGATARIEGCFINDNGTGVYVESGDIIVAGCEFTRNVENIVMHNANYASLEKCTY